MTIQPKPRAEQIKVQARRLAEALGGVEIALSELVLTRDGHAPHLDSIAAKLSAPIRVLGETAKET